MSKYIIPIRDINIATTVTHFIQIFLYSPLHQHSPTTPNPHQPNSLLFQISIKTQNENQTSRLQLRPIFPVNQQPGKILRLTQATINPEYIPFTYMRSAKFGQLMQSHGILSSYISSGQWQANPNQLTQQ